MHRIKLAVRFRESGSTSRISSTDTGLDKEKAVLRNPAARTILTRRPGLLRAAVVAIAVLASPAQAARPTRRAPG